MWFVCVCATRINLPTQNIMLTILNALSLACAEPVMSGMLDGILMALAGVPVRELFVYVGYWWRTRVPCARQQAESVKMSDPGHTPKGNSSIISKGCHWSRHRESHIKLTGRNCLKHQCIFNNVELINYQWFSWVSRIVCVVHWRTSVLLLCKCWYQSKIIRGNKYYCLGAANRKTHQKVSVKNLDLGIIKGRWIGKLLARRSVLSDFCRGAELVKINSIEKQVAKSSKSDDFATPQKHTRVS